MQIQAYIYLWVALNRVHGSSGPGNWYEGRFLVR